MSHHWARRYGRSSKVSCVETLCDPDAVFDRPVRRGGKTLRAISLLIPSLREAKMHASGFVIGSFHQVNPKNQTRMRCDLRNGSFRRIRTTSDLLHTTES